MVQILSFDNFPLGHYCAKSISAGLKLQILIFFFNFENQGSLPNILKMDRKMMRVHLVQFLGCIENRTVRSAFSCNTLFGATSRLR